VQAEHYKKTMSITDRKQAIKTACQLANDGDIILISSQGGMNKNPVWYYNIKANPEVDIMVSGGEKKNYSARQVGEDEKAKLWPHILSIYPDFDEYQARTDREIPVFLCSPHPGS
jgi:deazaflavin-dependent oxidoreductase (nitroreductase family)